MQPDDSLHRDPRPSSRQDVAGTRARAARRSSSLTTRRGLRALATLVAIVVASGCDARAGDGRKGGRKDTDAAEVEEQATPVVAGAVTRGAITNTIAIASTIEAEQQVTVHAESTGRIVSLKAEEGAEVKEGARLAQIKYDTQTSALDRANTSLSKATEDYDRSKRLFDSGAIGREELENAKNALDMAKLDVRDRRREMRNTKVIAPFSGTIVERQVAEGAFVTSGAALLTHAGATEDATPERIGVYRAGAQKVELFDFAALIDPSRTVNYALEDGDVVFVPTSTMASIGYTLRQLAPAVSVLTFGLTLGSASK